jgi:hypothetical protein
MPDVRDQENLIFGSAAGEEGSGGKLTVRVRAGKLEAARKDNAGLGYEQFSDPAYLTFPLQSRPNQDGTRGVILSGSFDLILIWRGNDSLMKDLAALANVFSQIGSLGFRSRRAMGALVTSGVKEPLSESLGHFSRPSAISVRAIPASSSANAVSTLGAWLRRWRSYGRTTDHSRNRGDVSKPPFNCGFDFAKRDHDIGYSLGSVRNEPAFRPALGLPIIQRISGQTNQWEFGAGTAHEPKGRFASPVILRPHRDHDGKWYALVIFVDAKQWPAGKMSFLNGRPRAVSLDLYNAMKADQQLGPFV